MKKIHKTQKHKVAFTMCGLHDSQVKQIKKNWNGVNCKNCLRDKENNKYKDWVCRDCGSKKKDSFKYLCRNCYMKIRNSTDTGKKSNRKYYLKNRNGKLISGKKYYENNKRKIFEKNQKRREIDSTYNLKMKVRLKHNNYVRYNLKEARCNQCGIKKGIKDIEIHHPDWDTPNKYFLLCKPCHSKIHGRIYNNQIKEGV